MRVGVNLPGPFWVSGNIGGRRRARVRSAPRTAAQAAADRERSVRQSRAMARFLARHRAARVALYAAGAAWALMAVVLGFAAGPVIAALWLAMGVIPVVLIWRQASTAPEG